MIQHDYVYTIDGQLLLKDYALLATLAIPDIDNTGVYYLIPDAVRKALLRQATELRQDNIPAFLASVPVHIAQILVLFITRLHRAGHAWQGIQGILLHILTGDTTQTPQIVE